MSMLPRFAVALVFFVAFLSPLVASADDACVVSQVTGALCLVDGKEEPCESDNLPPNTSYKLIVSADDAGHGYLFTGTEEKSAVVTYLVIKKGEQTFPAEGFYENGDGRGRTELLVHGEKVPAFDALVGVDLGTWDAAGETIVAAVTPYFEKHSACIMGATPPPSPAPQDENFAPGASSGDAAVEGKEAPKDEKSQRGDRKRKKKGKNSRRNSGSKGGGVDFEDGDNVHVEPELMD